MRSNSMVIVESANQAWENWFNILMNQYEQGFRQPSRVGDVVGEVLNAVTVINNPRMNIVESPIRNLSVKYAIGELLWYLSGSNKVDTIVPYAKFWEKISDDGLTLNSAYGYRIRYQFGFDQWEYTKSLLMLDSNSRQAVIHIKTPDPEPSKDVPCTVALQYQIRQGKLYATTYMRSNDIWLGFPYDVFAFTCLQTKMAMELSVDVGEYTHIAGSLHLYERNVIKNEDSENKRGS
jgi:thymidylate synthase